MTPELQELLDRMDGLDRGSPAWVNLADAFIHRVRGAGDAAPTGEVEAEDDTIVLSDLSAEAREAFLFAAEECDSYGMEILAPVTGYPDERREVIAVVQETLRTYRYQRAKDPPAKARTRR